VFADKIATGMSEARRLSAAAINEVHESVTHSQEPAPAVSNPGPSILLGEDKGASPVIRSNHESIDVTEEMDVCIDDSQPSIVANQVANKQDSERGDVNLTTATTLDDVADDEESDSPDEIPAKPVRKRPSTVTQDELPRSTVPASFHVPPEAVPKHKNDPTSDVKLQINHQTQNDRLVMPKTITFPGKGKGNHGVPYSAEEDSLLAHLREDLGIGWDAMPKYFCGRTRGSLQVRYSSKVKNRNSVPAKPQAPGLHNPTLGEAAMRPEYTAPSRRHPKVSHRDDGFVSWAELKAQRQEDRAAVKSATPTTFEGLSTQNPGPGLDFAHPVSLPRILRSREIGNTGRRNWSSTARMKVSDDLQNHVLDALGPRRYFHGASRDVTCVAWAADGNKFAAGAIAIDDERSMQYNRPNNLLLGNVAKNSLHELPEHHVARPIVNDSRNVNSLHAMQETQDTRLFKTVAAVGFSEDSRALYSAGADGVVRMCDASSRQCISSLKQDAELALLTSNSRGLLAAGSHRSDDSSISVIRSHDDRLECLHQFGPTRADVQSSLPIFPSALKWGAGIHGHLLLAGFASDSYEDDRLAAGEVFLWDSTADHKIELPAARNVFDVAWNPIPSYKASLFAVACARSGKQLRSSIECFAPNQGRASRVLQWDCPAFDINDLVYCPHDDNLIAAGATDGKVYIWDKRVVGRDAKPLHTLSHGHTKNVLDHDRDVEMADTGVRFLSWSATGNRLYSGSSDGTVKVWNPYRTTEDALVKDVATFNSAVMSGAFSPDYRDLLIGEDAGQLNLLGIDREARSVRSVKKFDYYPAPVPAVNEDKLAPARELLASGQVEVRTMGELPVKQVVQGPNYQGSFAGPSADQISHLQAEFDLVFRRQMDAEESLRRNPQDPELEKAFKAASSQIILSAEASNKMSEEREKYEALRLKASILQENFQRSYVEHERASGDAKSCGLDCNYLPTAGDEDGEAPDNRLSEQRIPHSLRTHVKACEFSDLTNAEIAESGLTSKCSACMGPAAKPKSKRDPSVCESCTLVRSGLTARCEKCAAPVRPNLDESVRHNICERCSFHCFRCGCIATIAGDTITCQTCDVQWEAGVLGYEVKKKSRNSPIEMRNQSHDQVMESLDERMGRLLGEDERERLAGGWRVALVDGY
jgi:WD40 repeat protein